MRRRSEPHTFEQRLIEHRERLEGEIATLPEGRERDEMARRIELVQRAFEMNAWLLQR